jgi:hypothetical protein
MHGVMSDLKVETALNSMDGCQYHASDWIASSVLAVRSVCSLSLSLSPSLSGKRGYCMDLLGGVCGVGIFVLAFAPEREILVSKARTA